MKRQLWLPILFLAILTTACSSDDNGDGTIDESTILVGSWNLTEFYSEDGTFSTTILNIPVNFPMSITGKDYDLRIDIGENPNMVTGEGSYITVASVDGLPDAQPVETTINASELEGEWRKNGNMLTVSQESEETVFEIVTLNDTELRLKQSFTEEAEILEYNATLEADQYFVFTRVQ
jgi:hypothetical protein